MRDLKELIEIVKMDQALDAEAVNRLSLSLAEDNDKQQNIDAAALLLDSKREEILESIRDTLFEMQTTMTSFFKDQKDRFDRQFRLDEENRREQARAQDAGAPVPTSAPGQEMPTPEGGFFGGNFGFMALATGLTAAVSGYVVGLTTAIAKGFATVAKLINPNFANISSAFTNFFKPVKDFVKALSLATVLFVKSSKSFDVVKTFVSALGDFFKPLTEVTKALSVGGGGGQMFQGISKAIQSVSGYFKQVFSFFSKIAVPLTVIISAVKAIFATVEEATGIWDGLFSLIKNLVKELVSAFVTYPLELVKDIISWIAGALGFETIENALDSFDIDDLFRNAVDAIYDGIKSAISFIADKLNPLNWFGSDDEEAAPEKRGMEIPRAGEQTYSIMTDSGMQDLTKEEIEQGKKDGTIKRSIANEQLTRIKEEEAQRIDGTAVLAGTDRVETAGRIDGTAVLAGTDSRKVERETETTGETRKLIGGVVVERNGQPVELTEEGQKKVDQVKAVEAMMSGAGDESIEPISVESADQIDQTDDIDFEELKRGTPIQFKGQTYYTNEREDWPEELERGRAALSNAMAGPTPAPAAAPTPAAPTPAAAPAPTPKVKSFLEPVQVSVQKISNPFDAIASPEEQPNEYVSVDPVSGKYRAYAPNLAATGKDAYALFDNVKEANEFTKSVDTEFETAQAAELAAFDAEFGTGPIAGVARDVADAALPRLPGGVRVNQSVETNMSRGKQILENEVIQKIGLTNYQAAKDILDTTVMPQMSEATLSNIEATPSRALSAPVAEASREVAADKGTQNNIAVTPVNNVNTSSNVNNNYNTTNISGSTPSRSTDPTFQRMQNANFGGL